MKKTVFFDRDGTVNYRIAGDYVKSYSEFHFIPDFIPFFKKIKKLNYLAILITNQQGVGKGLMAENQLIEIHCRMQADLLKETGFQFDDIFYCTELKETGSFMRKPNPGMILEAIKKWDINTGNSWVAGDSPDDISAGEKAGLKTILLNIYSDINRTGCDPDLIVTGFDDIPADKYFQP